MNNLLFGGISTDADELDPPYVEAGDVISLESFWESCDERLRDFNCVGTILGVTVVSSDDELPVSKFGGIWESNCVDTISGASGITVVSSDDDLAVLYFSEIWDSDSNGSFPCGFALVVTKIIIESDSVLKIRGRNQVKYS